MSPEHAIETLRHMKQSYTVLVEDGTLEASRRKQAGKRLLAIDTAIVAITRMEEIDANKANGE